MSRKYAQSAFRSAQFPLGTLRYFYIMASTNVVRLRNKVYMLNNMKIAVMLRTKVNMQTILI